MRTWAIEPASSGSARTTPFSTWRTAFELHVTTRLLAPNTPKNAPGTTVSVVGVCTSSAAGDRVRYASVSPSVHMNVDASSTMRSHPNRMQPMDGSAWHVALQPGRPRSNPTSTQWTGGVESSQTSRRSAST